jgi:hypothetical protein
MRTWTFLARSLVWGTMLVSAACASGNAGDDDDDGVPIDAAIGAIDGPSQHIDSGGPDSMPIVSIDGSPGAPDAMDVPPDATEVPPDATACTPITQQKLTNGSFDTAPIGTGWTQLPQDPTYPPIATQAELPAGVTAHTASNVVWLGGLLSSTDALFQQFAVPADATTMRINFQKWFATAETTANQDFLRVQIRNTADQVLETVVQFTPTASDSTWVPIGPLAPTGNYAGQTIRIYLQSVTNATNNTNFFLDTTSLSVVACP